MQVLNFKKLNAEEKNPQTKNHSKRRTLMKKLTDITDINRCLTDTENQFYKMSVISVKYRLSIDLHRLYRLNIGLLRFLP